jgi:hypothetical protein
VKERPILFSPPLVRAILAGTKTQTRRIAVSRDELLKPGNTWAECLCAEIHPTDTPCVICSTRFGERYAAGDRLWVRERWCRSANAVAAEACGGTMGASFAGPSFWYAADFVERHGAWERDVPDATSATGVCVHRVERWRPSIHMHRLASRLLLEVTSVRTERLQDITEDDARAEGVEGFRIGHSARETFRELWDTINGERTDAAANPVDWASNPHVWVISFKRVEADAAEVARG